MIYRAGNLYKLDEYKQEHLSRFTIFSWCRMLFAGTLPANCFSCLSKTKVMIFSPFSKVRWLKKTITDNGCERKKTRYWSIFKLSKELMYLRCFCVEKFIFFVLKGRNFWCWFFGGNIDIIKTLFISPQTQFLGNINFSLMT